MTGTVCINRYGQITCYTIYADEAMELWCEVFKQAMEDLNNPLLRKKSAEWFISNSGEIGSYLWVCAVLGLDSELVRMHLSDKIYFQFNRRGSRLSHLVSPY